MPHPRAIHKIPLDRIRITDRLRKVDPSWVEAIATSFLDRGQNDPIDVAPADPSGRYELVAGAHRVAAAKVAGWTEIDAVIFEGTRDDRRLREIDENLYRRELSALDRAVFLAERKALYERLYPESTKAAKDAAKLELIQEPSKNGGKALNARISFGESAAKVCGLDVRTIQLAIQLATRLSPDVRARIATHPISRNGAELIALSKLPAAEQAHAVDLLLAAENPLPSVRQAIRKIEGHAEPDQDATAKALARLVDAWNRASVPARRKFIRFLHREHSEFLPEGKTA